MFAPLLGNVPADIDRQVGWAQGEVRRQIRCAALSGTLAGTAALAALGAVGTVNVPQRHEQLLADNAFPIDGAASLAYVAQFQHDGGARRR